MKKGLDFNEHMLEIKEAKEEIKCVKEEKQKGLKW